MSGVSVVATDADIADLLLGVLPESCEATVVLVGDTDPAPLPVSRIVCVSGVDARTDPAAAASALRPVLEDAEVLVFASDQWSRDLAGYLAIGLDAVVVWAVDAIRTTDGGLEADRVVLGGAYRLVHAVDARRTIVLAKPTVAASAQGRMGTDPDVERLELRAPASRVRVLAGAESDDGGGVPLSGARVVISIGRGIGGPENVGLYRDLAERVGAALGASRVAVDSGWIGFAHQVGQTGAAVAPDVYVGFGISGAIQHMAGMRNSRSIIAVNTDHEAALCRNADLVICADANEVAKALLDKLER